MDFQLALSLLLVAASAVYLVLRIVKSVRRRPARGADEPGNEESASKPRPLRRL